MKKYLFISSRIIVGLVFLFSGFVKAVDPTGYVIKISEYLIAFHIEWLNSLSYILAIGISTLEFVTGAHLLLGLRNKFFSITATAFMAIFTPLTLFIVIFNPVTDCGCFGDALKLSNWETFIKNIILLIPVIYILLNRNHFKSQLSKVRTLMFTIATTLLIILTSITALNHLPELDFRPYHVGANITEGMTVPKDAPQPEYKTTFTLEKNGVKKEFTAKNYPYKDSTWTFINSKTKVIKEGYQAPIHDFVLTDDQGNNFTKTLLESKTPTLLVVSTQIKKGNWNNSRKKIIALKNLGLSRGFNTYVVTASSNDDISNFEFSNNSGFKYLTADETTLKTMIRSNPGLLLIQSGTIMAKWHYNDIPSADNFKNPIAYSLNKQRKKSDLLWLWSLIFASALCISILHLFKRK